MGSVGSSDFQSLSQTGDTQPFLSPRFLCSIPKSSSPEDGILSWLLQHFFPVTWIQHFKCAFPPHFSAQPFFFSHLWVLLGQSSFPQGVLVVPCEFPEFSSLTLPSQSTSAPLKQLLGFSLGCSVTSWGLVAFPALPLSVTMGKISWASPPS